VNLACGSNTNMLINIWVTEVAQSVKERRVNFILLCATGGETYSSTLSLTWPLDAAGGQRHSPAALPPGKRPGTRFSGGWVGLSDGLDECGKSPPPGIRSPNRPPRSESLYRLSHLYPRRKCKLKTNKIIGNMSHGQQ
jgi:hypothetical protein